MTLTPRKITSNLLNTLIVRSLKIQEQSNQALKQLIASGSIEFSKLSSLANICLSDALIKSSYDKKTTHYKNLLTFSGSFNLFLFTQHQCLSIISALIIS